MSTKAGVLLVGGGLAAVSAARSLRAAGYAGPVSLVCDEDGDLYDRPPLSKQYLAGQLMADEVCLFGKGEVDDLGITVEVGAAAVKLDDVHRVVTLDDGRQRPYRALLVATGAAARHLPLGAGLAGVHYLRSRSDADSLRESLAAGGRLVVIGAGFIGLEVAATAVAAGLEVTVLEAAPAPLTRVLGPEAGGVVRDLHAERGVDFRFGASLEAIEGTDRVTAVAARTETGTLRVPADAVVIGVGAIPRTQWLEGSAVAVDDGVVCDAGGRTSVPDVYAAGDVSRWVNDLTGQHVRVEQWQSAHEQGAVAGANMAAALGTGASPDVWASVPYFWSDQFDKKIQFCGSPAAQTLSRSTARGWVACFGDESTGLLSGVLAINAPAAIARGRRKIAEQCSWTEATEWLESL